MGQVNGTTNKKKYKHILWDERIIIEKMLKQGCRKPEIARIVGCSVRTITREIARGSLAIRMSDSTDLRYSADLGHRMHAKSAKNKGRSTKLSKDYALKSFLENKIVEEKCSPEAALQAAKEEGFETSISVTTLYNCIHNGDIKIKRSQLPRGAVGVRRVKSDVVLQEKA